MERSTNSPTAGPRVAALVALGTCLAALLATIPADAPAEPNPLERAQRHQTELFERLAPSVVFLTTDDQFGSGFFVSEDGIILTNAHVVGDRDELQVVRRNGDRSTGKVIHRADDLDLALVQIDVEGTTPPVDIASIEAVEVGSWVGTIGHGEGGIWSFTTGMVSNIYPSGDSRPVFQTQIPVNSGSSGGPVFEATGRVVGIVTSRIEGANDINFAITLEKAIRDFEPLADHCRCVTIRAPEGAPIYVDGAMVGSGPKLVVPVRRQSFEVFTVVGGDKRTAEVSGPKDAEIDLREEP